MKRSAMGRIVVGLGLAVLMTLSFLDELRADDFVDVSGQVTVTTANARSILDRRTRLITSTVDVTLTNTSDAAIAVPLHAVVTINGAQTNLIQMPGALGGAGIAPYSTFYMEISPGERFTPGQSQTVKLTFIYSSALRFTYVVTPYAAAAAPQNQPPVANAGPDTSYTLAAGQTSLSVTLDGSGSSDADGTITGYQWTGSPDPEDIMQPIVMLGPGTHSFVLMVTDDDGATSDADSVTITVHVTVPDLIGLNQAEADAILSASGLTIDDISEVHNDTVAAGLILDQSPSAGTIVTTGSGVDVWISLGPVMVPVPNTVGMAQALAEEAILNAGLTVGSVTQQPSDTVAVGLVSGQNPSGGSSVSEGTAIDLVVSSGPAVIDLTVAGVNTTNLSFNSDTLKISGMAIVEISNSGSAAVQKGYWVAIFEDRDGNGNFDFISDQLIGATAVDQGPDGNATRTVEVAVDGEILFKDNVLYAVVDVNDQIAEQNEFNNVLSTMASCEMAPIPVGPFDPVEEWRYSDSLSNFSTPVVIRLMDTTGDGKLDSQDVPYVLFEANGYLYAARGDNGEHAFATYVRGAAEYSAQTAAGDIDGDGYPEIVTLNYSSGAYHIICLENNGTQKWLSDGFPAYSRGHYGGPSIADMDQDGIPEIIYGDMVFNNDGHLRWTGGLGKGGVDIGLMSTVADLDMDGHPELVTGRTAYRADGSVYWDISYPDGIPAVADLDGDGYPEVVVSQLQALRCHKYDGTFMWSVSNSSRGAPPLIADVDGDGALEIGVASYHAYYLYNADGSLQWQRTDTSDQSGICASTAFDFNGDGIAEVIYRDNNYVYVYNGENGDVLLQVADYSATAFETAVVADVDNDGNAEIVVPGNHGVTVYGSQSDSWVGTRAIWNQHDYHITNVNDDGTIPAVEANNWQTFNNFRQNQGSDPLACVDLSASHLRLDQRQVPTSITITVRLGNGGVLPVNPNVPVSFYNGDPSNGGVVMGTVLSSLRLSAGEYEDISFTWEGPPDGQTDVHVVVDDDGHGTGIVRESNETNNSTGGIFHLNNHPPTITSSAVTKTLVDVPYTYDVEAEDADNEPLAYTLSIAPTQMAIDASTGLITWTPTETGAFDVAVRVSDTSGGVTTQSYVLTVSSPTPNGPPVADAGPDVSVPMSNGGKLVVSSDEYPMSNEAFSIYPEDTKRFVLNVADYFTGGRPGHFLVYSTDFSYGTLFESTLTNAGHSITRDMNPDSLEEYDGVFTGGNIVDLAALHEYIAAGGKVYIVLGTGNWFGGVYEHDYWKPLLNQFGVEIAAYQGSCGTPVTEFSEVPIFQSVSRLYQCNGNRLSILTGDWPYTRVVSRLTTFNMWVVYDAGAQLYGGGSSDAENDTLTYTWSIVSAPVGSNASFSNPAAPNPVLLADTPGTYVLELVVSDGQSQSEPDRVTVTILGYPLNRAPQITSTPITSALRFSPYAYDVTALDPDGDTLTYSLTTNLSGMAIDPNTGTITWTPSVLEGTYTVGVQVVDGKGGMGIQSFSILVYTGNRPPQITSQPPFTGAIGEGYAYEVAAVDPDGDILTYSLLEAPDDMSIDPQSGLISWTPTAVGTYSVGVQVTDGRGGSATQTFAIQVLATPNAAPQITSVPVTTAVINETYHYAVTATDPEGDAIVFALTQAPVGMTIGSTSGRVTWSPGSAQTGSHAVTVTATDAYGGVAMQSFSVAVSLVADTTPPDVSLNITPLEVELGQPVTITFTATDNTGISTEELTVNGNPLTIASGIDTQFTASEPGIFTVVLTVADTAGNTVVKSQQFRVINTNDTAAPVVQIDSPSPDAELTAPTQIIGTASDDNLQQYVLEYSPRGENKYTTFANGSTSVVDGELGELDTTLMLNGLYDIRLRAEDINGRVSTTTFICRVTETLKIGNFSLSFQDLSIPMAGLPITVTRTYDSRNKSVGDFGYGWSLGVQQAKVEQSAVLGSQWIQYSTGGLWPTYYLEPVQDRYVSITLPNGRVEEFVMDVSPRFQGFIPIQVVNAHFTPRPGTISKLEAIGDTELWVVGGIGYVDFYKDPTDPVVFDPTRYRLTTYKGMVYELDKDFGVVRAIDTNGNTITFTENGIEHSAGESVLFTRDALGRITRITDPDGQTIDYAYDGKGDLVSVTNREGDETTFAYVANHYLNEIVDPLGNQGLRNEYDASGRLLAQVDSLGNRIEFDHDIVNRTEKVADRIGNITTYVYDDKGRVLTKTDPLGNAWAYSYDDHGNKTSQTDPLDHTTTYTYDENDNLLTETDPLGYVTTYTYNTWGQMLSKTSALGAVTSYAYDANGNLLQMVAPDGGETDYTYNTNGLLISETDPLGNITTYTYDGSGRKLAETDTLGNATAYAYDALGRKIRRTQSRLTHSGTEAVITLYAYDAEGRLTAETDANGYVTQYVYDAAGRKTEEVTPDGSTTEFEYNARGDVVRTRYPDGTITETEFDDEGRQISKTDQAGNTTRFEYDAAGRLIQIVYPDGSTMQNEWDGAGRLIRTIDANGYDTVYTYDACGRQTEVVDAGGGSTYHQYDGDGRRIATIDALGNPTTFTYDAMDRLMATTYADGSSLAIDYDRMGRKTSETDPNGLATHFAYDAVGHLTDVTDPLGHVTHYDYDALGNRIRQIDANGNQTVWSYDRTGHAISNTLPLGMTAYFSYDSRGNRIGETDFNGDHIDYVYDAMNRMVEKNYPGGNSVTYAYTRTGQRQSITDTRGVTDYIYDSRNRLIRVINPDGEEVAYAYDPVGNRLSMTVSSDGGDEETRYGYDAMNRLVRVTNPNGDQTQFEYDLMGRRTGLIHPDGTHTTYAYDTLGHLVSVENFDAADVLISAYDYTLDAAGKKLAANESDGREVNYTYDALYRLVEESVDDPTAAYVDITSYTYDAAGNRLSKTSAAGTVQYGYDANNRLVTETGPGYANVYAYDANGNRITFSDGLSDKTYTYDYDNRLVHLQSDTAVVTYQYDDDGLRIAQEKNGQRTHFLYDINRKNAQLLEERDSANALLARYEWGGSLDPLNMARDGAVYHYLADGNLNIRQLVSEGVVTDRYTLDAFGNLTGSTGSTSNPHLLHGQYYDDTARYYYLRARWLDPSTGVFTAMDPASGTIFDPQTLHKYLYAANNPIDNYDPSGRFTLIDVSASLSMSDIFQGYALAMYSGMIESINVAQKYIAVGYKIHWAAVSGAMAGQPTDEMYSDSIGIITAGHKLMMQKFSQELFKGWVQLALPFKLELFKDVKITKGFDNIETMAQWGIGGIVADCASGSCDKISTWLPTLEFLGALKDLAKDTRKYCEESAEAAQGHSPPPPAYLRGSVVNSVNNLLSAALEL